MVRELDERLGLSELIAEHLTDSRGKNKQLADLVRQAVYSRLADYEDVNDTSVCRKIEPSGSWVRKESGSEGRR